MEDVEKQHRDKKLNQDVVTANQTKAFMHITGSGVQSATFSHRKKKIHYNRQTLKKKKRERKKKKHLEKELKNELTTPGVKR